MAGDGQFNGKQLISKEVVRESLQDPQNALDLTLNISTTITVGGFGVFDNKFGLQGLPIVPDPRNLTWYGWTGNGGSVLGFSPHSRFSFAYVPTSFDSAFVDGRWLRFINVVTKVLERLDAQKK